MGGALMPAFVVPVNMGQLTINPSGTSPGELETNMRCPAWMLLEMAPFWDLPNLRGESIILPEEPGRYAFPQIVDETTFVAPLHIIGDADYSGAPNSDKGLGLWNNRVRLLDNVHTPSGATRVAKLTLPGGGTKTADVRCSIKLGSQIALSDLKAVFTLTIPAGVWT